MASPARGDAAGDLANQGANALSAGEFDVAAKDFDQIIAAYPNTPNIDDIRLKAGYAYLHLGNFTNAINRLAKETAPNAKPEYRSTALYFTALAQFSEGQKSADKTDSDRAFRQAVATLTDLIQTVTAAPTATNRDYLEDAIYYRALAQYKRSDYDDAEKDLQQLLQQFSSSLKRPDYLLLLGSLYAVETNQAVINKQSTAMIRSLADKALKAFDQVSTDPNALVQANDANMSKAEVLYLIAQLDSNTTGYQKALEAFRLVQRKDDMVQLQQTRLDELKKASENALQNTGASFANENSRLLEREEGRLADLQSGPDPIIQALIRMAECYVAMKQPDEARTILHRLVAHATLTPEQQQEIDFQLLYSYALGGQTDQADAALTDYLNKHPSDSQADSISYQIAAKLLERKDYTGALSQADRSLHDFPNGRYASDAIALKAEALTRLGRTTESNKVVDDFLMQNPNSPVANQMFLTKAQSEAAQGNFDGALVDYKKVKDNPAAGELQSSAVAGYIQTLQSLQKFDDVISEAKAFEAKYPDSKALPGVLVFAALAMDQKHDPGAIAALQDMIRKYPKDEASPFALSYIVNIHQRAGDIPAMIQAAKDLRAAYPTAYTYLVPVADAMSAEYVKEKKFDLAVAEYQGLIDAKKPEVAAAARNKIGAIWLAAAKAMGGYQSMQPEPRAEAQKRLSSAEQAYLGTLKNNPEQLDAVGDAFQGLVNVMVQRRSWGLLTDADMEDYLGKLAAGLATPEMQARLELAEAGLVLVKKNGEKQYPAALDRFKKAIAANPGLRLTPQETDQFGELLIAGHDYPTALQVYHDLMDHAAADDLITLADAYYGLGATYLAQGNVENAKIYFSKMKALKGGAAWHPHILDADYGLALADEQSSQPADNDAALKIYSSLMRSPQAGFALQAKAMLGYGRLLEKAGHSVAPATPGTIEYAVHYYQEVPTLFGPAVPALSAEGLFLAGQAYEKAGDSTQAKQQYSDLIAAYGNTAPDWAAKAQAAAAKL